MKHHIVIMSKSAMTQREFTRFQAELDARGLSGIVLPLSKTITLSTPVQVIEVESSPQDERNEFDSQRCTIAETVIERLDALHEQDEINGIDSSCQFGGE